MRYYIKHCMSEGKLTRIRIGVSHCLLGEAVRYDGGHKKDAFLTETLQQYFEWTPVCPEVEVGMGIPRESVRLVDAQKNIRMVGIRSGTDWTERMDAFSRKRVADFDDLCGFIFKKDSPSCGLERVRIYRDEGSFDKNGRGLFADAVMKRYPLLPVEEEGRLQNPVLRENFIERVFCYFRLRSLLEDATPAALIEFHTAHKMVLLAHSTDLYRELGRIVSAAGKNKAFPELMQKYASVFMETLRHKATRGRHANVLMHLLGYLKKSIDSEDKTELLATFDQYRKGLLPLIVPVTLLKHHFRKHPIPWVEKQAYFHPYPAELMLRNHV